MFEFLASKAIWKPYLKHDIFGGNFFAEKHMLGAIYLNMGRNFEIHLWILGWKWGLAALKKWALSKRLLVKNFDPYKI